MVVSPTTVKSCQQVTQETEYSVYELQARDAIVSELSVIAIARLLTSISTRRMICHEPSGFL